MKIGIGLPAYIPNVEGSIILDWARQADNGPFSSLGVLDRLTYGNYEPLVALAAAAGATKRIRLMTTVLLAPIRNTTMLAKQSASLDALSGGRLTLGLGVGAREEDFHAASAPFHTRGKRYNEQLALLTRIWSGEAISDQVGPIGPAPTQPGGPEVLIGGYSPAAVQRVRRWGNGFISGGGSNPHQASAFYRMAEEAWKEGGRPGKPRLVACAYYGLGANATEGIGSFIHDYYAFRGPAVTQHMVQGIPATPEAIRSLIWEMAGSWQTFTQIASQFEPVDRERLQLLFERAHEAGLLRSDFVPTIQFMMLVPWCQIYLSYLPLYQRLVPEEDLASAPRLADARDYLVDFIVAGMMNRLPETKPEKEI